MQLYPVALAAYPPTQAMASWNGHPDDHAPESVRVAGLSAPRPSYAQQNSEDLEAGNARASSARSSASWRWMPLQLQSLVTHISSGVWPTSGRKQPHAPSIRCASMHPLEFPSKFSPVACFMWPRIRPISGNCLEVDRIIALLFICARVLEQLQIAHTRTTESAHAHPMRSAPVVPVQC